MYRATKCSFVINRCIANRHKALHTKRLRYATDPGAGGGVVEGNLGTDV